MSSVEAADLCEAEEESRHMGSEVRFRPDI